MSENLKQNLLVTGLTKDRKIGYEEEVAFNLDEITSENFELIEIENTLQNIKFAGDPFNNPQRKRTLSGHSDKVLSLSLSLDGKILASGSADGIIKIWSLIENDEIFEIVGHEDPINSINFSPDGRLLVSGSSDNLIKIWNLADKSEECVLKGHLNHVLSVSFSPN